jgi:peptidoglycan hydrolase CwlO-like protein
MKIGRYLAVIAVGIGLWVGGAYALAPQAPLQAQQLSAEERAKLQAEYDKLQIEIQQWQKVLDETRAKKGTLQGDVTALNAQIAKAQAEINQRNNTITTLAASINQKTKTIATLESRLEDGQASLAKLLREKNYSDKTSLVVLALTGGTISEFFANSDRIDAIDAELQEHFNELRGVKTKTQEEKQALAKQQNQQLDARKEVEVKKAQINEDKKEKDQLLAVTKQDEAQYSKVLAERQAKAAEIRARLFNLRDTGAITFESALKYAQAAEAKTGVRAAFILGILRQESNLGANVGQCLLVDPATGAGKGKNTGTPFSRVMNPTRDVPPFLELMKAAGRDPFATPVSCPQSIGYGGAMGPSQFIASTWKGLAPRIAAAAGVPAADPWTPSHAIMATAIFLSDLGAGSQTYSAEREAAGRYYAGGNWATLGLGYANSVLSFATSYQNDINFLKDN